MEPVFTIGLGLALGFVVGISGVGGGALMAPALYVVVGLPFTEAVTLALLYSIFTKIAGFLTHLRQGTVHWPITLLYGLPAIPGAVLGSQLVYAAKGAERPFALVMGAALMVAALLLLLESALAARAGWKQGRLADTDTAGGTVEVARKRRPLDPDHIGRRGGAALATFSFAVGIILGITSVGSGSIIVTSMLLLLEMPAAMIVGSNVAIGLMMVVPAGVTHFLAGGVDGQRLLLLVGGSLFGTIIGSRATLIVPERGLRVAVALLVMLSAAATIAKAW